MHGKSNHLTANAQFAQRSLNSSAWNGIEQLAQIRRNRSFFSIILQWVAK